MIEIQKIKIVKLFVVVHLGIGGAVAFGHNWWWLPVVLLPIYVSAEVLLNIDKIAELWQKRRQQEAL